MSENQELYYLESGAKLKESLMDLQTKLDEFAKASDLLTSDKALPVKMTNRVGIGEVTRNFSELARSIFVHQDKIKAALTKVEVTGETSES